MHKQNNMKTFLKILKINLFLCLLFHSSLTGQILFPGIVQKMQTLNKTFEVKDSLVISYFQSFTGNMKILVNDSLVWEIENRATYENYIIGHQIIKKDKESDELQVMTIIFNDLFYIREVLEFKHSYLRIYYEPAKNTISLGFSDIRPINE